MCLRPSCHFARWIIGLRKEIIRMVGYKISLRIQRKGCELRSSGPRSPPGARMIAFSALNKGREGLPRRTNSPRPSRRTSGPVPPTRQTRLTSLIVGAGPHWTSPAQSKAQKSGFKALILDKGCLVNSIFHYPTNMDVFSRRPELLEIGDISRFTSFSGETDSLRSPRILSPRSPSITILQICQYHLGEGPSMAKTATSMWRLLIDRGIFTTTVPGRSSSRTRLLRFAQRDRASRVRDLPKVFHYYPRNRIRISIMM